MRIVVSEHKAAHVASITKSPVRGIPARFLSANRESTIQGVVNQRVLGNRCHVHHLWVSRDQLPCVSLAYRSFFTSIAFVARVAFVALCGFFGFFGFLSSLGSFGSFSDPDLAKAEVA